MMPCIAAATPARVISLQNRKSARGVKFTDIKLHKVILDRHVIQFGQIDFVLGTKLAAIAIRS